MKYSKADNEIMLNEIFKIIENKTDKNKSLDILSAKYNRNSIIDGINSINAMLQGKKYTRTINANATRIAFDYILNNYGVEKLNDALYSTQLHIDYYENIRGTRLHKIREIVTEYSAYIEMDPLLYFGEVIANDNEIHKEGNSKYILVNRYERNARARQECIKIHGCKCSICSFDFEEVYGELGKNYIHVHHIKPLSEVKREYVVNPQSDLIPICANCHAIIHRQEVAMKWEELKKVIKSKY